MLQPAQQEAQGATLFERAKRYVEQGKLVKACRCFQASLRAQPPPAPESEIRLHYARALAARERHEEALAQLAKDEDAPAQLIKARSLRALARSAEALAAFERAAADPALTSEASREAGAVCLERKDWDAALRSFCRAAQSRPEWPQPWLDLALAWEGKDHLRAIEAAVDALRTEASAPEESRGRTSDTPGLLSRSQVTLHRLLSDPSQRSQRLPRAQAPIDAARRGDLYVLWSEILIDLAERDAAAEQIARGLEVDPARAITLPRRLALAVATLVKDSPERRSLVDRIESSLTWEAQPAARYQWDVTLAEAGLADHVLEGLLLELSKTPAPSGIHGALQAAVALVDGTRREAALAVVVPVLEQVSDPAVLQGWADLFRRLRMPARALRACELAERAGVARADAASMHMVAFSSLGALSRMEDARMHLRQALRECHALSPDASERVLDCLSNETAEQAKPWFPGEWVEDLGELASSLHDARLLAWVARVARLLELPALKLALEAFRLDPDCTAAHAELEQLRWPLRHREHLEELVRCSARAATHDGILLHARLLAAAGRRAECFEQLARASRADPERTEAHLRAAELHRRTGQVELCSDAFARAVEAAPESGDVYTSWANALGRLEAREGPTGWLARVLGGDSVPASAAVDWDGIRAAQTRIRVQLERLVRALAEVDAPDLEVLRTCADTLNRSCPHYEVVTRIFQRAHTLAPRDGAAALDYAIVREREADSPGVLALCDAALEQDARYAYLLRGKAYTAMRQFELAYASFENAFPVEAPDGADSGNERERRLDALGNWALALCSAGKYEEAIEKLQEALALDANHFWNRFQLALTYGEMRLYERAVDEYQALLDSRAADHPSPDPAFPAHNIAALWEEQGHYRVARQQWMTTARLYQRGLREAILAHDGWHCVYYGQVLSRVLLDPARAETVLRAARLLDPTNPEPAMTLVRLYHEQHAPPPERQGQASPGDEPLAPGGADGVNKAAALAHCRMWECYRTAEQILDRRLGWYRGAETLRWGGQLRMLVGDTASAEPFLREACEKNGDSAEGWFALGDCQVRLGKYREAIRSLENVLRRAPHDIPARALLARAHREAGELDEAEAVYRRNLETATHHVDSMVGLGEVFLDMADKGKDQDSSAKEQHYSTAIQYLSRAIQVASSPDRPIEQTVSIASAHYLRGYARVQLYELSALRRDRRLVSDAKRDFERACHLDPTLHKATRALERIHEFKREQSPVERVAPAVLDLIAALLVVLAFVGLLWGVPARRGEVRLTQASRAELSRAGVAAELVEKALRPLEEVRFRDRRAAESEVASLLGKAAPPNLNEVLDRTLAWSPSALEWEPLGVGWFAMLVFGALLIFVASAFLPQLTLLKLGGIQLEKSAVERSLLPHAMGVSR